jgi:hypothetical protein
MKTTKFLLFALLIGTVTLANAQDKVDEDRLLGTWKLVIDIEEELDQEADDEDNPFARMLIRGVSGLVEGIMENIEIYFDFQSDGEVRIQVNAFDEEETEYAEWTINRYGELIIEDVDNDNIQFDNDDIWMMEGRRLVSYESDGERNENVYMVKVE